MSSPPPAPAPCSWANKGENALMPCLVSSKNCSATFKARQYTPTAESGRNRILAYDRWGQFLRAFDADDQLLTPFDLVRDDQFIWVVEKGKNSLTKIDIEARQVLPNSLFDAGRLLYPDRLEMVGDILYLLDKASGTIYSLDGSLAIKNRFACKECDSGFVDFKVGEGKLWALEQA